jgi:hypothetical protein
MAESCSRLNLRTVLCVLADIMRYASWMLRRRAQLVAENLFLRKQLALYVERQVGPRRADDAIRLTLVGLSRFIEWRQLLIVVKPGDADPMTSQGIPTVLAMEIEARSVPDVSSSPLPAGWIAGNERCSPT